MSSNTLYDHLEAIVSALAGDTELNALAEESFGAPLLITLGSYFGPDNELGVAHTPYVAVTAGDADADVELYRVDGPAPRTIEVRIITGVPMATGPVPPLPKAVDRYASTVYRAGQGALGEQLHLAVIKTATEIFSAYGLTPQTASLSYSGSTRWPVENYDSVITLATPRVTNTGAL